MSSTPGRSAPALVRTTDFGRWVDAVNCHFLPLEASTAQRQRYQGGFRVRPLDSAAAGLVWTSPCAVTRSRRQADAAEHGYFKILWQLTGHSQLAQRGRSLPIAPGTVAVYDATQPYRLDMSDACRFAVLTLSTDAHPAWRTLLESRGPQLAGPGAATRAGLAALLSLLRGPDDKAGADAVAETIGALVMAALACGDKPPRPARHELRLEQAQRAVLRHLDDPALGPDLLARALGVSRRTLYLLFRRHGTTPAAFILETRLQRCRAAIEDPVRPQRTLTEIAYDHGFSDSAYFSRAFRAHFGVCPSDWRSRSVAGGHG